MTAGHIYTVAGNGTAFSGDGGPPLRAEFTLPTGVSVDRAGDIAFTAVTAGDIYVVVGGGTTLGDGGPATSAQLSSPFAVAVSPAGSLLVTDGYDNRLRAISP